MKKLSKLLVLVLVVAMLVTMGAQTATVSAVAPTMTDLWNGTAHFNMVMNRLMYGQTASGSSIVPVNGTWYWFHRSVYWVGTTTYMKTVCEKSTDKGVSWSAPVDVLVPASGTPYSMFLTDGSFYYDSANNKWRALMQSNNGTGWTMCYFERAGEDPMGLFSVPSGFTEPAVTSGEIWNQLTTTTGKHCVDIPGGTGLVSDEGTPQIIGYISGHWYITFHGASLTNGTCYGYRGCAWTDDFQTYHAYGNDDIADKYTAQGWNVPWLDPLGCIGVGAASILNDTGYWYQIIEAADVNLGGNPGQNWAMHILRSADIGSGWQNCPNTYPILAPSQQLIEWQYPTLFKDNDGTIYLAVSKYAPATDAGFRIYKLIAGSGNTTPGVTNQNIIDNPSFEENGLWTTDGGMSRSTDRAHSGTYSLKAPSGTHTSLNTWYYNLLPSTTYTFSAWIYKTNSVGNAYFDMNDRAGEPQPIVANGSGGGVWTYVSQAYTTGSGQTSVQIRCVTDGGTTGNVYFDEISIKR